MDQDLGEPLCKVVGPFQQQESNASADGRRAGTEIQELSTTAATSKKAEHDASVNELPSIPPSELSSNSILSFKDVHGIERKLKIIRVEKHGNTPSPRFICMPANGMQDHRKSTSSVADRRKVPKQEEREVLCSSSDLNRQLPGLEEKDVGFKLMSMLGEAYNSSCESTENASTVQSISASHRGTAVEIQSPPVECEVSFHREKEMGQKEVRDHRKVRKILTGREKSRPRSGRTLTYSRAGQDKQVLPCHLCGSLLFSRASVINLNMQEPLPLSALHPPMLLATLGMSCPLPRGTSVALCKGCNDILVEADLSYKKLQTVIERMKEAWPGNILETSHDYLHPQERIEVNDPTPPKPECISVARKYVPILPKPDLKAGDTQQTIKTVKPRARKVAIKKEKTSDDINKLCICGFCGMEFYGEQDWKLHVSAVHRVQSCWLMPGLQATLKVQIRKELERPESSPHSDKEDVNNLRNCFACGKHFSQRLVLVQHLQEHHNMAVEDEFLESLDTVEEDEPSSPEPLSESTAPIQIKAEVMWDNQTWEPASEEACPHVENPKNCDNSTVVRQDSDMDNTSANEDTSDGRATIIAEKASATSTTTFRKKLAEEEMCVTSLRPSGGPSRGARWWCRACGEPFPTLGKLHRHKQQNHPGMLRLTSRTPKKEHAREATEGESERQTVAKPAEEEQDTTVVTCMVCGLSVEGKETLRKHMEAAHEGCVVILEGDGCGGVIDHRLNLTAEPEGEGGSEAVEGQDAEGKKQSKLSCRACGATFSNLATLAQHQHQHHKDLVDECGGAVGSSGIMMVECELCGRRIHGLPALRLHMTKSHNRPQSVARPHRCKLCLFQTRTRSQLEHHMRLKHGVNVMTQVECKMCGKTLNASYLDRHIANMHENKKRFACEFCGMRFNDRGTLKSHIYFEHANKNWRCEPCQLSFSKYHRLRQHNYYVHSTTVYTCNTCGKAFKRKSDHTEHIKRKHMERVPTQCPRCPNTYLDRKKLRTHLMRKHDVPWEDTISRRFARLQRESNCFKARDEEHNPPASKNDPGGATTRPRDGRGRQGRGLEVVEGSHIVEEALGEDGGYNIVEVTEAPGDLHTMGDISYIILQAGEQIHDARGGCHDTS